MAKITNTIYKVRIYCRLSKEDEKDNKESTETESASIATQKSILSEFVKAQG